MLAAPSMIAVADNISYQPRQDRTIAVITTAFHDPAKTVRDGAERAFYHFRDEPVTHYDALISEFANSPALGDGAAAVLHTLENSRQPPAGDRPRPLRGVYLNTPSRHRRYQYARRSRSHTSITRLTLRIHAQHTDIEIRRRSCSTSSTNSSSYELTTSSPNSTPSNADD